MELKKRLENIEAETVYILAGLLVVVAVAGFQVQERTPGQGKATISTSLTVDNVEGSVRSEVELSANSTVFDALNKSHSVEYTEYDFGYFITSVDGISQNQSHSWLYQVNNQSPNKAVNKYVLEEGDRVILNYTSETS